jgi:putative transcriptional regulator
MEVRAGSLLVAHPAYSHPEHTEHLVYITESTAASTMGITLNQPANLDLSELINQKSEYEYHSVPYEVFVGGEYNPNALIMMHSDSWYSSNTMQVDNNYSISSDNLMIEKLEMGNIPDWFRLFVGCKGWTPGELEHELKSAKPKWLLLRNPSLDLIESSRDDVWKQALEQCSQQMFQEYF